MALSTPDLLDTITFGVSDTEFTSNSITPTGGALLIVGVTMGVGGSVSFTASIDDTLADTGSWSQVTELIDIGSATLRESIFYAVLGSSPGSGTVTVTTTASISRVGIHVIEITGQDASPVAQNKTNTGTASTLTVTLDSTPETDSCVIGVVGAGVGTNDIGFGSGFTEIADTTIGASGQHKIQSQYDQDNADTTCDWSNLPTTYSAGCAIEISAAESGPGDVSESDGITIGESVSMGGTLGGINIAYDNADYQDAGVKIS